MKKVVFVGLLASTSCNNNPDFDLDAQALARVKEQVKQSMITDLHRCSGNEQLPPRPNIYITRTDLKNGEVPTETKDGQNFITGVVNESVAMDFEVDTGATTTNIPREIIRMLGCNGLVTDEDVIRVDWATVPGGMRYLIPYIRINKITIQGYHDPVNGVPYFTTYNIPNIVVSTLDGPILFGRNFISSQDLIRQVVIPLTPEKCVPPRPYWDSQNAKCAETPPLPPPPQPTMTTTGQLNPSLFTPQTGIPVN